MNETIVAATMGREIGSPSSRRLRNEGRLPGVIYGLDKEPINVAVNYRELRDTLKGESGLNTVFKLDVDGAPELVLVRNVQRDPVKQVVLHCDFLRVDPNAVISITVPIQLVGEATEVSEAGALVDQILYELETKCSPVNIPDFVEADISVMAMDRNLFVSDLKMPAGVEADADPETAVAAAVLPRAAVEETDTTEEGVEGEGETASADSADSETSGE